MGIVVHEFRDGDTRGYVNTMRKDLPEILEVDFQGTEFEGGFGDDDDTLTPVLFHRDRLPRLLRGGTAFDIEFAYVVPTDLTHQYNHYDHCRIGCLSLILERYFQHPSQLEFEVDGASTAIVQATSVARLDQFQSSHIPAAGVDRWCQSTFPRNNLNESANSNETIFLAIFAWPVHHVLQSPARLYSFRPVYRRVYRSHRIS